MDFSKVETLIESHSRTQMNDLFEKGKKFNKLETSIMNIEGKQSSINCGLATDDIKFQQEIAKLNTQKE